VGLSVCQRIQLRIRQRLRARFESQALAMQANLSLETLRDRSFALALACRQKRLQSCVLLNPLQQPGSGRVGFDF
jgi:hypothetical protein